MAKDKLFVNDGVLGGYRITWYLAEEGDEGATLGDGDEEYTAADLAGAKAADRQHIIACMAAAKSEGVTRDCQGYLWETRRAATVALRACNLAMKNDGGPPWPEWALKAAAEGWKAPKGWKAT